MFDSLKSTYNNIISEIGIDIVGYLEENNKRMFRYMNKHLVHFYIILNFQKNIVLIMKMRKILKKKKKKITMKNQIMIIREIIKKKKIK